MDEPLAFNSDGTVIERIRWTPCVCGGVIFTQGALDTIERAVIRHNNTVRHLLWRLAREQPAELPVTYTERDPSLERGIA